MAVANMSVRFFVMKGISPRVEEVLNTFSPPHIVCIRLDRMYPLILHLQKYCHTNSNPASHHR